MKTCRVILQEQLEKTGISHTIINAGCVQFNEVMPQDTYNAMVSALHRYNIEIIDNNKTLIVQKTKDIIAEVLKLRKMPLVKMSAFLEEKLNMSCRNIAKSFAEISHMSIEEYIIMQKIEQVKAMLINAPLTLTEIAHTLQYSSVAHLSN